MKEARKRKPLTIAFRKCTKTHQCYSRCWKCCPPSRMHSEQQRETLFTLGSS